MEVLIGVPLLGRLSVATNISVTRDLHRIGDQNGNNVSVVITYVEVFTDATGWLQKCVTFSVYGRSEGDPPKTWSRSRFISSSQFHVAF